LNYILVVKMQNILLRHILVEIIYTFQLIILLSLIEALNGKLKVASDIEFNFDLGQ
jgi:hypothetical protein